MATVLNRTTKALITSANTVEYPVAQWIIEPDLTAVATLPSKYWVITGDVVSPMPQAERDALDAAILSAMRDGTAARMDDLEDVVRALALATLDELNLHAQKTNAILDAIDGAATLAALKTAVAAITDVPQRTGQQLKNSIRNKLGT